MTHRPWPLTWRSASAWVQVYWWHDKYRPRKPKYFNRVHTGYEWNKYNQTHYDHDNPPPKVVQVRPPTSLYIQTTRCGLPFTKVSQRIPWTRVPGGSLAPPL